MREEWIPVRILDRRIKDGWFGRSYYVTIKFLTNEEHNRSPIGSMEHPIKEWKVGINTYHSVTPGEEKSIKMYEHSDGLWRPSKEE